MTPANLMLAKKLRQEHAARPRFSKDQAEGTHQYAGGTYVRDFRISSEVSEPIFQSGWHLRQFMELASFDARSLVPEGVCPDMCVSSRFVGFGLADVYFKARFAILRTVKLGSRTIDA